MNRDLLESLADNSYIRQGQNVILIGATGSGKSFTANALRVNACQSGYKTRYIRLPELFSELEAARIQGKYHQVMKQFQKLPLVILDEFLLIPYLRSGTKGSPGADGISLWSGIYYLLFPVHARRMA